MMLFEDHGSREEFEEMVLWVFEEYASADSLRSSLDTALFSLTFRFPGEVRATNMSLSSKREAVLNIPLIDFFTLEEPIRYFADF